jgi:hypothetical protein
MGFSLDDGLSFAGEMYQQWKNYPLQDVYLVLDPGTQSTLYEYPVYS